ncbi:MAG TPA: hypothetical protein VHK89_07965 [Actinomycetota bacterium]|nr:hypothetical protein [Actinomycetota bacterium]
MVAVWSKRIGILLLLAFTVAFVVTAPTQAADVVRDGARMLGDWLAAAGRALLTFLGSLIP